MSNSALLDFNSCKKIDFGFVFGFVPVLSYDGLSSRIRTRTTTYRSKVTVPAFVPIANNDASNFGEGEIAKSGCDDHAMPKRRLINR